MKPDTNFQVYPSTAKREKKTLKYIARTCLIYITLSLFFSLCSARINLKVRIRLHKRVAYVPIII